MTQNSSDANYHGQVVVEGNWERAAGGGAPEKLADSSGEDPM